MKANELRLGNWFVWGGQPFRVSVLAEGAVGFTKKNLQRLTTDISKVTPIPLTEEWLVKGGFVSDPYQDMYIKGWLKINCDKTKGKLELWVENITGNVVYLNHVHTLQNVIFALTNEELTFTI